MNYTQAAREMVARASDFIDKPLGKPSQDPRGLSVSHAHWMLLKIEEETSWSDSKKGRWLGWAQAIFCVNGFFSLEEMKELNRGCSEDPYVTALLDGLRDIAGTGDPDFPSYSQEVARKLLAAWQNREKG